MHLTRVVISQEKYILQNLFDYCRSLLKSDGNFKLVLQLQSNTTLRQKTQSFDFDEILTNSPPWPPVNGLVQNCVEDDDDKETGTGEWVDKVMVNKLDVNKTGNMLGCWETDNGNLSEEFYQKYLQDSSQVYSERSYNMFMRGNQFNIAGSDDTDDVDAATSDSSEHDLLWQFNHSKVTSIANGNQSKGRKFISKSAKSPAALR
jgi:kinesin family protein C2/C3